MNNPIDMVLNYNRQMKEALETIYNALNFGQKKKIIKNDAVVALFDRYGIDYKGDEMNE